jgi:hypothetical protein
MYVASDLNGDKHEQWRIKSHLWIAYDKNKRKRNHYWFFKISLWKNAVNKVFFFLRFTIYPLIWKVEKGGYLTVKWTMIVLIIEQILDMTNIRLALFWYPPAADYIT